MLREVAIVPKLVFSILTIYNIYHNQILVLQTKNRIK